MVLKFLNRKKCLICRMSKTEELRSAYVTLRDDGILFVKLKENYTFKVDDVKENLYTKATAFLISSTSMMLLGNFYLNFHHPTRPTKIFTSEEKAVAWLQNN